MYLKRLEWFLKYHGGEVPGKAAGTLRDKPYSDDLLQPEAPLATLFLEWVGENFPGWPTKTNKLGVSVLETAHAALSSLYGQQLIRKGGSQSRKLMDNSAYHTVYKTIKNRLAAKGERPDASEDPLKNTAGEVMTSHDILRVCQHLMNSNSTAADRNLSLNNWLLSTCGRSDDGRLVFQADFCPPKLIKSLGPAPCWLMSAVVKGGKAQKNGKKGFLGGIRHENAYKDCHAALGRWLVRRYTVEQAPYPDPKDAEAWNKQPMWPAALGSASNVSYDQQYKALIEIMKKLGISTVKVTHTWRVAGAQVMDAAGVDDSVMRRSGKWLYDSLSRSYLEFFKAVGLLGAGGWPGAATNELHMFWHERFVIPTPPELIVLLFPFLPNLEQAIKELAAAASLSMYAAPLILKYLARVVIQDAAGGMSRVHPDHDVHVLLNTSSVFRSVEEEHQRKRAAGYFNPFQPYLMAERMLNFESLLLDVVEAVQSGKRADVLDAPAMRRMQLAQQQQLLQDQEAQHCELERVLEIADRERADSGTQGAEDDETDAGGN
ncbi:TPA: hypothetical protein ACH3X1_016780 [Trebouxia sp. C0004]